MKFREIVLTHLKTVIAEFSPLPIPDDISDDMQFSDFWLDSVAFTNLVTKIEADVGFIPMGILRGVAFPETIGDLIQAYEDENI